jgi:hypothetical protein
MKRFFLAAGMVALLTACASTPTASNPRHAPNCKGEYAQINSPEKYPAPADQGAQR